MERKFKYYPEDFKELSVKVEHMDLFFDVFEDHTQVKSDLHLTTREEISTLELNANALELTSLVSAPIPCTFEYNTKEKKIFVKFDQAIAKGEKITITTESICRPTSNVLEGLYFDETPSNCPVTQITQCQQWGFQRLVPCIDDMTAKCTYITTIRADKRYTNIITNGDKTKEVTDVDDNRVEVVYDNTVTPMATYLFFLGVGTYATFTKEFRYPSGDSFMLELLVPPDSDKEIANQSLEILHDAILWIYLFTGRDTYKNQELAQKIWDHYKQKDFESAKELAKDAHWGYKYTGKVYREIGMQNSDFGGMENVGNTTITTNRIMPYPYMSDEGFHYMTRVKAHEYYHNLNGSEVTGWSPFEIWLNEAVTVFIEQKYSDFMYGEEFERLATVRHIIAPHNGVLAQDASPASIPIEPVGFNDPNELITGITYVKAPEFVRMIETFMGKENFVKGLDAYHTKYKHSNAKWQDWIACMEEYSDKKFSSMADGWLRQTKYPILEVTPSYNDGRVTIITKQKGYEKQPYEFPFLVGFFKEGKLLKEELITIKDIEQEHHFDLEEPDFYSFNRGLSFYGKVDFKPTRKQLFLQVKQDTDVVNRFVAFDALIDAELTNLIKNNEASVDTQILDLFVDLLHEDSLVQSVGGQFLAIGSAVKEEAYAHKYEEQYAARETLLKAIAEHSKEKLLKKYQDLSAKTYPGSIVDSRIASMKDRQVKNLCLAILQRLDTSEIHEMIKKQFLESTNASDKMSAFRLYLRSSATDKNQVIEDYEKIAAQNLVTWESFLVSIASNDADDALKIIKRVSESNQFRIDQANDQRALFAVFFGNRRKSMLTEEGRVFCKEALLKLAPVNEYNTNRALQSFGTLPHLDNDAQEKMLAMLKEVLGALDKEKTPSVHSTIDRLIKSVA